MEINNFYTMTVYEKGAEVIRMFRTLLSEETYRKATDLYFERYDGMAVTCEDWAACMEDASGLDLSQFKLWYSQAGTPVVKAAWDYDEEAQRFTLTLGQSVPPTPGQAVKEPMHIPVRFGLLGQDGGDLHDEEVLHLTEAEQVYVFEDIAQKPVPSLLRGFSAPVILKADYHFDDLAFLMIHDTDGFNRWEAGQELALKALHHMLDKHEKGEEPFICPHYLEVYGKVLDQGFADGVDKALLARALAIPDISMVVQQRENVDPPAIHAMRQALLRAIKVEHREKLSKLYEAQGSDGDFAITPEAMGQRALRNVLLSLLSSSHGSNCAALAKAHYEEADNMTDRVAALSMLTHNEREERVKAFADFYDRFKDYPLVMDKWFSLQACSTRDGAISDFKKLSEHPDFNIKNPNRVRSLYGAFANNNPALFHAADGSGYDFLTDAIIALNEINPQIAARLLAPMRDWRRYSADRQAMMKASLERILETANLSANVFEIASKSLKG